MKCLKHNGNNILDEMFEIQQKLLLQSFKINSHIMASRHFAEFQYLTYSERDIEQKSEINKLIGKEGNLVIPTPIWLPIMIDFFKVSAFKKELLEHEEKETYGVCVYVGNDNFILNISYEKFKAIYLEATQPLVLSEDEKTYLQSK